MNDTTTYAYGLALTIDQYLQVQSLLASAQIALEGGTTVPFETATDYAEAREMLSQAWLSGAGRVAV